MLEREQRMQVAGVALLAFGVLVFLALIPAASLGPGGPEWFPSGNVMGPMGALIRTGTTFVLGIGAWLLPVLIGLAGIHLVGWIGRERWTRAVIFTVGLALLLPLFAHVVAPAGTGAGWFGAVAARPLLRAAGLFGAVFILLVLLILLWIATAGTRPLRSGAVALGRIAGAGWRRLIAAVADRLGSAERDVPPSGGDLGDGASSSPLEPPSAEAAGQFLPDLSRAAPEEPPAAGGGEPPGDGEPEPAADPSALPPIRILTPGTRTHLAEMERELDALGAVLIDKLRTFNVEGELAGRTTGPVVTQFEVVPAPGVKVNRIVNLDRDLALALRARTVRIVAPIPGKGAVGVEIPNPIPTTVQVREILESGTFGGSRAELPLALGRDLHGASYVADLAKMPHCLIAGATGSGKSVCLNTIITSLVYRHTPETLRLLLVDPKMVELSTYGHLPHLRHPVVTEPTEAAGVLKWAMMEMERRYALLSENGVRSIGEFNQRVRDGEPLRRVEPEGPDGDPDRWLYREGILPFVVLVVDELADLMMSVQSEVEKPLTLLAQKARAIGLHLLVATQRPSVNVITGLIKANFPCRIAFRVASKTDSRTIIDQNGADALLGNGDMLFLPPGQSVPIRMQGAFISTEETSRLIDWYREASEGRPPDGGPLPLPGPEDDILELVRVREEEAGEEDGGFQGDWDELFRDAAELCIQNGHGSTSLLQRRLRVGYGRAARIVDQLHEAGVLGPPDGSKPREVTMGQGQLDRLMSGSPPEG